MPRAVRIVKGPATHPNLILETDQLNGFSRSRECEAPAEPCKRLPRSKRSRPEIVQGRLGQLHQQLADYLQIPG